MQVRAQVIMHRPGRKVQGPRAQGVQNYIKGHRNVRKTRKIRNIEQMRNESEYHQIRSNSV